jgi:hypothetical protein
MLKVLRTTVIRREHTFTDPDTPTEKPKSQTFPAHLHSESQAVKTALLVNIHQVLGTKSEYRERTETCAAAGQQSWNPTGHLMRELRVFGNQNKPSGIARWCWRMSCFGCESPPTTVLVIVVLPDACYYGAENR